MSTRISTIIDWTIGLAGLAFGVGIACQVLGWVAADQRLSAIGLALCTPLAYAVAAGGVLLAVAAITTLPYAVAKAAGRAWRGEWPLL